jgi:DNA/RNA endonuclease G (NUC1)
MCVEATGEVAAVSVVAGRGCGACGVAVFQTEGWVQVHTAPVPASGYDQDFLGVSVPLPVPAAGQVVRELAYTHFTVLLDPTRRLAVATGVNVAGAELRDVERSDDWRLDPRVGAGEQAGSDLYAGNDLDREASGAAQ